MNLDLDFILLNLLLLYTFWKAGRNISQSMDYWHNAGLCVILFSIVQGCRFARGNDYFAYSRIFREGSLHVENPFFSVINELLRIVGINEYSCFMVYAFTFALCAMIFMKDYRTYARYMFPLFLIGFMNFEESMIRQAFSYSFFFLYLKYLFKLKFNKPKDILHNHKKLINCIIFAILTLAIHTGNIISLFVITTLYIFWRKPFQPQFAIPIYVACVYILPHIFNFNWLEPILSFAADTNERAAEYVKNADYWFSEKGENDQYDKNFIVEIIQVIGSSALMYFGYRLIIEKLPKHYALITMLNTFIIGLCIESIFVKLEILHRIGQTLDIVGYFALAIVVSYKTIKLKPIQKVAYVCLLWFVYYYVKYLFFSGRTMFIWDTHYPFFKFI